MCDCYGHKCEMCDTIVPMHIGDFKFPREAFMVWCNEHVDYAHPGAVVFTLTEAEEDTGVASESYPKGWRCAILGPEVGGDGDNHPNISVDYEEAKVPWWRGPRLSAVVRSLPSSGTRTRCHRTDSTASGG